MDENLKEEYLKLKEEILEFNKIIDSLSKNDSVKKYMAIKKNRAVKEYLKAIELLNYKREVLYEMESKLNDRKVKCNHPLLYLLNKQDDIYICKCLECGEIIRGRISEFDINYIININEYLGLSSNLNRYNEVKEEYDLLRENRYPMPVIIKKLIRK